MEIELELQNGHSQRTIAEKYGVAKSTVGDIWKYRQKLEGCIARLRFTQKGDASCVGQNAKIRCSCQWLETQGTATEHLILVKKWRDSAARKTDITSYFSFSQYACAYSI